MNFYSTWAETRELGVDDLSFMHGFLTLLPASQTVLFDGTSQDIEIALSTLSSIPVTEFINGIALLDRTKELTPAEVPCFSTFTNGAIRINELLEFAEDGLTYVDIGYQLMKTQSFTAQSKYGENHSKLAAAMSLVSINVHSRPANIRATSLGHYLVSFPLEQKANILRKLLLRDHCLQALIQKSLLGSVSYRSTVKQLSDSTAYRRRTSVKQLIEFALGFPETEYLLHHIMWDE